MPQHKMVIYLPKPLEEATKSARIAAERFASDAKTDLGGIRHAS